ncbi:hypothetical protein MODO_0916 [Myroides odoratimimus]|nr:hypothetical protein MODO_0916 [Myroides odoratimimus]
MDLKKARAIIENLCLTMNYSFFNFKEYPILFKSEAKKRHKK